jgi:hypothetical protein
MPAIPVRSIHTIGSVNQFLCNSARTDLIGPEMWTVPDNEQRGTRPNQPENLLGAEISSQLPHHAWDAPALGLPGAWCYGHHTNLSHIIQLRVSRVDGSQSLECRFMPVRHVWTPAGTTTYFRSLASGLPGEYPFAGLLTIKERKCITADNVFVSELTLINDQRVAQQYRVEILTPYFSGTRDPNVLRVQCKTVAGGLGQELPIDSDAVLIGAPGDFFNAPFIMAPQQSMKMRYAFAVEVQGSENARARAISALNDAEVFEQNAAHFDSWFERNVPALETANQDWLKPYYYRWFVLYRAWHNPRKVLPDHPYPRPAFYESPLGTWFGCVIGLSVPVQIQEAAWLRDPEFGAAHIRNWAEAVNPEYRNYIQFTPRAIWGFFQNHPDRELLRETYSALKEYALAEISSNDPSRLPVQGGSWMSGAEYQPNFYQFTEPQWDWRYDVQGHRQSGFPLSRMIRLDNVAFKIANLQAASRIASVLGQTDESRRYQSIVEAMLTQVKSALWDPKTSLFYAAHPETGALADQAACYDSFAPFMWGLVSGHPYLAAFEKFFDENWFWSEFPITTVAKNSPMYWSGNSLTGPTEASIEKPHQYTCCWNGPTWHFSNSLSAEALGSAATSPDGAHLRERWIEFMTRWAEMHFLYGDRSVPCALEHVRPTDGVRFRTIVDYFHSAWIDPFISYWAGIRIDAESNCITFDPFTHDDFTIRRACVLGRELSFTQSNSHDGMTKSVLDFEGKVLAKQLGPQPLNYFPPFNKK